MQAKQKNLITTFLIIFLFSYFSTNPHGFGASTFVRLNSSWQSLETICRRSTQEKNILVATYNLEKNYLTNDIVVAAGLSTVNYYIRLGFDPDYNDWSQDDVICAPYQELYLPARGGWVSACDLRIGDELISYQGTLQPITYGMVISESIPVYIFKVKHTHTFFVGRYGLLTHNMNLVNFNILSCSAVLPFGIASGTICAGPIGATAIGVAAIAAGLIINACIKNTIHPYKTRCFEAPAQDSLLFNTKNKNEILLKPNNNHSGNRDNNSSTKHPNGIYENAPYHHPNSKGLKSAAPKNGQKALDNSVEIKPTSKSRVGTSEGEIVVLDRTAPGIFHGHIRTWDNLNESRRGRTIKNTLIKNGLTNNRGKIT